VSLVLLYPAYYVQPGDFVTLRGSGFTSTGNTVHIGATLVHNLSSADGSIHFAVPHAASSQFQTFSVFVSNAKGVSNALTLAYR
jgi:type V secretory pathway adhesin AidA